VGAAAELARPRAADLDDADVLAVGLAEQCQRTDLLGAVEGHDLGGHREVLAQRAVGDLLHVAELLRRQAPGPAEVEPQVARAVVGAGLQRGGTEHLTQRRVDDVRAGVRLTRAQPPLGVDLGLHGGVEG
jgi:hypothetical protein